MIFSSREATQDDFLAVLEKSVKDFESNNLFQKIKNNQLTLTDYHNFLKMIYHQTFYAGPTFARAGSNCFLEYPLISRYLIHHSDEEKDHWKWVLEDLRSSGYQGLMPDQEFPSLACQAYISFNTFLATEFPIARLGTAAMLEHVGGRNGKKFAEIVSQQLGLRPNQLKFLFGHGDTDLRHSGEILDVLHASKISSKGWAWLSYAASTAGVLYRDMYEEIAK